MAAALARRLLDRLGKGGLSQGMGSVHTNCTVVWVGTTPVSCSTQGGYYCAYIVVTP